MSSSFFQKQLFALTTLTLLGVAVKPAQSQANLITNGDFSSGNTGFSTGYVYTSGSDPGPGTYTVGTDPHDFNAGADSYGDHTTGSGLMLLVDGSQSPNVPVWSETVTVTPLTTYNFSFFVSSWGKNGDAPGAFDPASLQVLVNGIVAGPVVSAPSDTGVWEEQMQVLPSLSTPTATITLVDLNKDYIGNDFALDDLKLTGAPVPEASTTVSFGLLLALGLGSVVIAAWKKKAAASA